MNKTPISPRLWAPIHTPMRGRPWINWACVRSTRVEARNALLRNVVPERQAELLARVRFARVTITEDVPNPSNAGHTSK